MLACLKLTMPTFAISYKKKEERANDQNHIKCSKPKDLDPIKGTIFFDVWIKSSTLLASDSAVHVAVFLLHGRNSVFNEGLCKSAVLCGFINSPWVPAWRHVSAALHHSSRQVWAS